MIVECCCDLTIFYYFNSVCGLASTGFPDCIALKFLLNSGDLNRLRRRSDTDIDLRLRVARILILTLCSQGYLTYVKLSQRRAEIIFPAYIGFIYHLHTISVVTPIFMTKTSQLHHQEHHQIEPNRAPEMLEGGGEL